MASRYAALGAVIWNLELHAAAHVLRRDIYVLDGEVKSFTHGGKGRAICLFYDDQVGHYEWIDGDVMMFWATPHQGTRLQGGGKRSHASTDGSLRPLRLLRLADFASVTSSKGDVPKTAASEPMCLRAFASPEPTDTNTSQAGSVRLRDFASQPATKAGDEVSRPGTPAPSSAEVRHLVSQDSTFALETKRRRLRAKTKSWISLAAHCGGRDDSNTPCGTAGPPQGPGSCGSRSSLPVLS